MSNVVSSTRLWEELVCSRRVRKKVTIFINEDTQHHLASLCDAILTFLLHKVCPAPPPRERWPASAPIK